jgi:hypothetical protein
MKKFRATAGLLASLAMMGAQAAKVPLYDDFSGTDIDRVKWAETETERFVDNDKHHLLLGRLVMGGTTGDSGVVADNLNLNMTQTAPAKSLRATIKVIQIRVDESCPANHKLPSIPVAYTSVDNVAPALQFNNVGLRNEVPNCLSGARVKGGVEAEFDDVGLAQ